jgi:ComF family protein
MISGPETMKSRIPIFKSLLHLFFPFTCCGCGTDLIREKELFCLWCQASTPVTGFEILADNPIEKIFWGRMEIQAGSAHMYFTNGSFLRHGLHLLKYKGKKEIGIYFGRMMGNALKHADRFRNCEIIVPLPLFTEREKKRGYNQAAMIAAGISEELKIPVLTDAVIRTKSTESQTRKTRIQRWENMSSKFEVRDNAKISGKHILLVDDVITTGASIEACGLALLEISGLKLSVACLAYTVWA